MKSQKVHVLHRVSDQAQISQQATLLMVHSDFFYVLTFLEEFFVISYHDESVISLQILLNIVVVLLRRLFDNVTRCNISQRNYFVCCETLEDVYISKQANAAKN